MAKIMIEKSKIYIVIYDENTELYRMCKNYFKNNCVPFSVINDNVIDIKNVVIKLKTRDNLLNANLISCNHVYNKTGLTISIDGGHYVDEIISIEVNTKLEQSLYYNEIIYNRQRQTVILRNNNENTYCIQTKVIEI